LRVDPRLARRGAARAPDQCDAFVAAIARVHDAIAVQMLSNQKSSGLDTFRTTSTLDLRFHRNGIATKKLYVSSARDGP
jgi:hypothetical protein